jgi:hypothetical protein
MAALGIIHKIHSETERDGSSRIWSMRLRENPTSSEQNRYLKRAIIWEARQFRTFPLSSGSKTRFNETNVELVRPDSKRSDYSDFPQPQMNAQTRMRFVSSPFLQVARFVCSTSFLKFNGPKQPQRDIFCRDTS